MNNSLRADDSRERNTSLILFVTGDAPRSRRAQLNLTAALEATGLGNAPACEIDVLREPEKAISFGIFATPALMHVNAAGQRRVVYGDLSDENSLQEFLSAL